MLYLYRTKKDDQGTEGILWLPEFKKLYYTLELPDRNNQANFSHINTGDYTITFEKPRRRISGFDTLYYLHDVPKRSGVFIHAGTWAGDTEKGFKKHSKGCPLIGKTKGFYKGQKAVFNSRSAVRELHRLLNGKKETLIVRG